MLLSSMQRRKYLLLLSMHVYVYSQLCDTVAMCAYMAKARLQLSLCLTAYHYGLELTRDY